MLGKELLSERAADTRIRGDQVWGELEEALSYGLPAGEYPSDRQMAGALGDTLGQFVWDEWYGSKPTVTDEELKEVTQIVEQALRLMGFDKETAASAAN